MLSQRSLVDPSAVGSFSHRGTVAQRPGDDRWPEREEEERSRSGSERQPVQNGIESPRRGLHSRPPRSPEPPRWQPWEGSQLDHASGPPGYFTRPLHGRQGSPAPGHRGYGPGQESQGWRQPRGKQHRHQWGCRGGYVEGPPPQRPYWHQSGGPSSPWRGEEGQWAHGRGPRRSGRQRAKGGPRTHSPHTSPEPQDLPSAYLHLTQKLQRLSHAFGRIKLARAAAESAVAQLESKCRTLQRSLQQQEEEAAQRALTISLQEQHLGAGEELLVGQLQALMKEKAALQQQINERDIHIEALEARLAFLEAAVQDDGQEEEGEGEEGDPGEPLLYPDELCDSGALSDDEGEDLLEDVQGGEGQAYGMLGSESEGDRGQGGPHTYRRDRGVWEGEGGSDSLSESVPYQRIDDEISSSGERVGSPPVITWATTSEPLLGHQGGNPLIPPSFMTSADNKGASGGGDGANMVKLVSSGCHLDQVVQELPSVEGLLKSSSDEEGGN